MKRLKRSANRSATPTAKGEEVVQKNMQAVDETLAHLTRSPNPGDVTSKTEIPAAFPGAPKFEHDCSAQLRRTR